MYSISQEERVQYNTVRCHVTWIGYIPYKLCKDWHQLTAQPDVCVGDYLFWWVHESRWPPTGRAVVVTKYRNCWHILLYIQKLAWGNMKNKKTIGETLISPNRFLETYIILPKDRCNSSEYLFDNLEERVLWRRAYGNMVRGCGINLSGFV